MNRRRRASSRGIRDACRARRLAERALFFLASRNLPSIQLDREEAIDFGRQNSIEIKPQVYCDKMSRTPDAISGRAGEAG